MMEKAKIPNNILGKKIFPISILVVSLLLTSCQKVKKALSEKREEAKERKELFETFSAENPCHPKVIEYKEIEKLPQMDPSGIALKSILIQKIEYDLTDSLLAESSRENPLQAPQ